MQILKNIIIINETNEYINNDFYNKIKIEGCSVNYNDKYSIIYAIRSCPEKQINELNNKFDINYQ